jgi:hypothetical protein
MAVHSSAGSTVAISAATPATFNEAGYDALAYTLIGEVTDIGDFGREYNVINHNPVATRATVKLKGSYNEGSIQLQFGLDNDDAGQALLQDASESDNNYSFRVILQDGSTYYFQAQVTSFKTNVGGVDAITGGTATLEITSSSAGVGIIALPGS